MLALHGGTLLVASAWLGKQHNNWALRPGCAAPAPTGRRMRTIRRLIYREVLGRWCSSPPASWRCSSSSTSSTNCPTSARASPGYRLTQALVYVTLMVPSHLYELLPIAVLIGTIFVMARLAQSSEYTILRTSGLGPWRALRTLLALGAVFTVAHLRGRRLPGAARRPHRPAAEGPLDQAAFPSAAPAPG
jgi:hypothetical protein